MNFYIGRGKQYMDKIKPVEWLWYPLIPKNCISILASRGGVGKSGFALWLANELSSKNKSVCYIDAERCGFHIKQRISDWNLSHWEKINFIFSDLPDGSIQTGSPSTILELSSLIKQCSPDLTILDSLTVFSRNLDTNRREVMAHYFEELTKIAVESNCAILILAHTKKKQFDDEALNLDSIAGSGAITDLARSVLIMDFGKSDNERIISQLKINLAEKSNPITFTMSSTGISNVSILPTINSKIETKAEKYRQIATDLLLKNTPIKQIRSTLSTINATPVEQSRAIKQSLSLLSKKGIPIRQNLT